MKPSFEKVTCDPDHSFGIKKVVRNERANMGKAGVWHFHPDYEITYTLTSRGKRFVGYDIEDYHAGDLVMVGEGIPHCWITSEPTQQIVINFKKDFLGHQFLGRPELKEVSQLLERSRKGLKFGAATTHTVKKSIINMENAWGFDRLMALLAILEALAKANDATPLTQYDHRNKNSLKASNRIEKVYSYVLANYRDKEVSLKALSESLNMTESALCKFIKQVTRKTLFGLVMETRVNEACRLLAESDKYVSEIGYLAGFNNLSNFNKTFKRITKKTPVEYRKIYTAVKV